MSVWRNSNMETCDTCGVALWTKTGFSPCGCVSEAMFGGDAIPGRFVGASLSPHNINREKQAATVAQLQSYADQFSRKTTDGVYLWGPKGAGKSYLACGLMRELMAKAVPCVFFDTVEMLSQMKAEMNQNTETSVMADAKHTRVLFLDDLGAERPTEWALQAIREIITHRYNQQLPTIITSNLSPKPLSGEQSWIGAQFDDRIASRLLDMCEIAYLSGADLRQAKRRQ